MTALYIIASALGVPAGSFDCAVCGSSPFGPGERLGQNFTDFHLLRDPSSRATCAGCTRILGGRPGDDPPPLRTTSFAVVNGRFESVERARMWSILVSPPAGEFVLSYAASRQKHHALRAGVSTAGLMLIGGDNGVIEFVSAREAPLLKAIRGLLSSREGKPAFTRTSIETGAYSPSAVQAFGAMEHAAAEIIVRPYRRGRKDLLDLLLWCCPSEETTAAKEAAPMIDAFDSLAGQLLGAIARGSSLRAEDGLRFWGKSGSEGLIATRANRFRSLPLRDFTARMLAELQVSPTSEGGTTALALLNDLSHEDELAVSRSIRERTALIVQLAFGRRALPTQKESEE